MYCYLHIPKTAGTSLKAFMTRKFGDELLETNPSAMFQFLPYVKTFKCIVGHLPLFLLALEDFKRTTFTTIRNPHDRVVSFMNHVLGDPGHASYPFFQAGLLTTRDFMRMKPFIGETYNLQTRMLGVTPSEAMLSRARAGEVRGFHACLAIYGETKLEDHHLEQAERNLRRLQFGVFDYLPYVITQTFRDISGSNDPLSIPRLSEYPKVVKVADEIRDMIEINNRYDAALHSFARNLFLERAAVEILRRGELVDLPGAPASFKGLHAVEESGDGLLRWTTDQTRLPVCVPVNVERCRVTVDTSIIDSFHDNRSASIRISDTVATELHRNRERISYEVICEPMIAGSVREFVIEIDSLTRRIGDDPRNLGLPLRSIRVQIA